MATSGVYVYTLNTNQLILAAFRLLNVFNDDNPAPATDIANAQQTLNLLIRQWIGKGAPLWVIVDIIIPLVAGQDTYTIGPSGSVAGVPYRPIKMYDQGRLRYTNQTPPIDQQLTQMSRQEWALLSQKQAAGPPNSFYYDPLLINGVLHLYLEPDSSTAAIAEAVMTCQRPLQAQTSLTDSFDFADEWINPLKYNLASEMICDYAVDEKLARRIESRADKYAEDIFNSSVEEAGTFFTPNYQQGNGFKGR